MTKQMKRLCRCVAAVATMLCMSVAAQGATQEITIGYIPNYGTVQVPTVSGYEGYGYEYFTAVFRNAEEGYAPSFQACNTWKEGLAMLEAGEIDVFGPVITSGLEGVVYGQHDFGSCQLLLAALDTTAVYYGDYDALENATIGIPLYYQSEQEQVESFLVEKDITAELVMIPSNEIDTYLQSGDIDFVLISSLQTQSGLQAVARIGSVQVYYITSESQPELMEAIDFAMDNLEDQSYLYQTQLYAKYLDYGATAQQYISPDEYALLQQKQVYRVGVRDFASPLCYETASGTLDGIAFDVMAELATAAGITFEFEVVSPDTPQAVYDQLDMLLIATTKADSYGFFYESDPYVQLPFLLFEDAEKLNNHQALETIGVVEYYQIDVQATDGKLFERTMVEYRTIDALELAFQTGEVDSIMLTVPAVNTVQEDLGDKDFSTQTLDLNLSVSLSFSDKVSPDEIAVFNKLISRIDATVIDASIIEHSVSVEGVSVLAFLQENPVIIIGTSAICMVVIAWSGYSKRKSLHTIVNVDNVTGLMTEMKFCQEARRILDNNPDKVYRIVMVDVDNFKYINEIFGYEAGTQLLQLIGDQIQKNISPGTLVGRGTGDVFFVLAPRDESESVFSHMDIEIEEIRHNLYSIIGKNYKLHFSFGIYEVENRHLDITRMMDFANLARLQGKGKVGTTMNTFTQEMQQERTKNNEITSIMEQALADEEFVVHYQPKVNMNTGLLSGAEALVRWGRSAAMVPPYQFIPLFERNGFVEQLDYYVLSKACVFLNTHPDFPQGKISVNLSGVTLLQDDVVQSVMAVVQGHNIAPERLDLEITESAFVEDGAVLEKVQELRSYGFSISMDDFGAGVSSLNRLKNIQVDTLKIDREFIIDAIENPRSCKILQPVIQMAKALQLETVAEGIETEQQCMLLQSLGCDVGQGFYYAKPMPETEFTQYYRHHIQS